MKLVCFLTLALVFFTPKFSPATTVPPKDVSGWQSTKWGMPLAVVKEKFGSQLVELDAEWEDGGMKSKLGIENYIIAGQSFTVIFFFDNQNKLVKVVLDCAAINIRDLGDLERALPELTQVMSEKYGDPVREDRSEKGKLDSSVEWIDRWKFPSTNISFLFKSSKNPSTSFYIGEVTITYVVSTAKMAL